jgi:hypothetical protein
MLKAHVKKARAGYIPITTVGFGNRGQVYLIDMQSFEFQGMKWLLNYRDHGTNFAAATPLPTKKVRCEVVMFFGMTLIALSAMP